MRTALIYLNGGHINEKRLKGAIKKAQYIIAVDGGANYLYGHKIIPDVLIGDMDSIHQNTSRELARKSTIIIRHPKEKDQTDSELAISYAMEQGCKEIVITGFVGDRFDHMIATIHFLSKVIKKIKVKILQNNEDIYFVMKSLQFQGKKDDEVSIIPLLTDAKGVTTKGLQYRLNDELLNVSSTRGVSNVMSNSTASISLKEGTLMIVHRHL